MDMKHTLFLLTTSALCGALAGAAAGFATSSLQPAYPVPAVIRAGSTTSTVEAPKAPTSTFAFVPLERRSTGPLLPPAFAKRSVSAIASIYRKPKGTALEDRALSDDRLLGQAVALTSDGWFVADAAALDGLRLADLTLWRDGTAFSVERGVIDHLDNVMFLKTNASNLPTSAFAHLQDLQPGAEIWLETRPGELAPTIVRNVDARTSSDPVSSEIVARRVIMDAATMAGDVGGAAWDPNGSLVGIIESKAGERVRLIPGSSIGASFNSLLTNGEIRHASLGILSIDLADLRIDGTRDVPASGALVRDDRKTGKTGVTKDSAAAKAKLKSGDVILRVDRDILDGSADLGEILSNYQPGASVTLRVVRAGVDSDMPVTLGQTVTSEAFK